MRCVSARQWVLEQTGGTGQLLVPVGQYVNLHPISTVLQQHGQKLPYILAHKSTIFGRILTMKLWGSAYTRVMPHSHTLTARVSTAWTIGRPLGLYVQVYAWECAAGSGTTHRLLLPYQLRQPLWLDIIPMLTPCKAIGQPKPNCHMRTSCSRRCEGVFVRV